MPRSAAVPDAIVGRYRAVSLARLAKIEAAWLALVHGERDLRMADELEAELHALKGDSRAVGFGDVSTLCHKMESALPFARRRRFRIPADLDATMMMGFQFASLLLRGHGSGRVPVGMDPSRFLDELDGVLAAAEAEQPPSSSRPSVVHTLETFVPESTDRLCATTRQRFAAASTDVYLAYLAARGPARERLRSAWQVLSAQLSRLDAMPLGPLLSRHVVNASELGAELGKRVEVKVSFGDVSASGDAVDAIDVAVLHAVRNAIDHGLEKESERRAAGKRSAGVVSITGQSTDSAVLIEISDDGRGIDLRRLRERAVELGIWDSARAAAASDDEALALIFEARFSTRTAATEVSGRGVGLRALKDAIEEAGGTVHVTNRPGRGLTLSLCVPRARTTVGVHLVQSSRGWPVLAVLDEWEPCASTSLDEAIDPLDELGLGDSPALETMPAVDVRVIAFERNGMRKALRVGSACVRGAAQRLGVTAHGHPAEVVSVSGDEVLLVHPHRFQAGDSP